MKFDWKRLWSKSWPHLVAIVTMMLLVCVYFSPEIINDKQLPQGDMISSKGMGADAAAYEQETGERPHWSNAMFSGMPHNYTHPLQANSVYYPLAKVMRLGLPADTAAPLWIMLLSFYIFMLCMGCSPWLSLVGAIAFAFASYNIIIIDAGHVTKAYVIATIPALIGGVMLCYRQRYAAGLLLTLLATGLHVHWNHQQISYYALIMLMFLAIGYFIWSIYKKEVRSFFVASALLVAAAGFAIAPALGRLVPAYDYSKDTMRGGAVLKTDSNVEAETSGLNRDYAFMWSYGKAETMTLLIPNFYGASSNYPLGEHSEMFQVLKKNAGGSTARQFAKSAPTYWGAQPFTSGPVYAGAIICFLFVLGLLVVPQKERWWLFAVAIVGIFLSWGRNFPGLNNWLFDHLPLYNKFRTPAMALVITTTAMAIMGMMALREVIERRVSQKSLYIAAGITGGICLLFALFPSLAGDFKGSVDSQLPDWLHEAMVADRRHLLVADAWRSLIFIALAFGMLWLYLKKTNMKSAIAITVTGLLILVDLWSVDKHYLNDSHFVAKKQQLIQPTEADKQILQDKDPDYRVLNLASNTFNESHTSYFHKSVGGYSPAKLRRYQDIIDYYFSGRLNMNVLNMLNTRYCITREGVQYNPDAFGNAWFVQNIQWVNNPNEEIEAIGTADLRHIAVIDTVWQTKLQQPDTCAEGAMIRLSNYAAPDHLYYESQSATAALAVFSEVYYKTWRAFVDGNEVPVIRANYILRAIEVPAGQHEIEFRCEDIVFEKTNTIVLITSIVFGLLVLTLLGLLIYKSTKKNNTI